MFKKTGKTTTLGVTEHPKPQQEERKVEAHQDTKTNQGRPKK